MKSFGLNLLKKILKVLARWTVRKYKPGLIGITGSVGKTSTKYGIYAVLKGKRKVRVSPGNFNNEIGFPLAILSDEKEIKGKLFWLGVILRAVKNLIFKADYPQILILEYGADKPGDIKYLLQIARPQIGIITSIGNIPVHVEFYSSAAEVAKEKTNLIASLPENGFAFLNRDETFFEEIRKKAKAKILTYGFSPDCYLKIVNFKHYSENGRPGGISFKLEYGGNLVPVKAPDIFGKPNAYVLAVACGVGLVFGENIIGCLNSFLKNYGPVPGRMNLIKGVKNTYIIDDSYNASPSSMKEALDALKELEGGRKIAVLGDMLELGKYTLEAHKEIGRIAASSADLLFTVGPRAKFIAQGAKEAGLAEDKVFSYILADEAKKEVELKMREGDLVLVKGSRAMRLEKIIEEIKSY